LALHGEEGGARGVEDKDYTIKVANDKYDLTSDFNGLGKYDEALPLFRETIVLYAEGCGYNSLEVGKSYNSIGEFYRK
jgi:hypothetical protein